MIPDLMTALMYSALLVSLTYQVTGNIVHLRSSYNSLWQTISRCIIATLTKKNISLLKNEEFLEGERTICLYSLWTDPIHCCLSWRISSQAFIEAPWRGQSAVGDGPGDDEERLVFVVILPPSERGRWQEVWLPNWYVFGNTNGHWSSLHNKLFSLNVGRGERG